MGKRTGKIKVLQVNKLYCPWIGGVERVVQQIAEGLKDSTDMKVLVCQQKGRGVIESINGVTVHKASSFGMYFSMPISFDFFIQFFKLSKEADIIHIHMPFPLADLALLLSGYKGRVVLWWHSDIVKQKKLLIIYRPFLKWLLKRADLIMVATKGHVDYSDFLLPYSDKCKVIPFAVDPSLLIKSEPDVPVSNKTSITCSILYVGRLVYYKGCDILISAMSKVHGAELMIVGDGPLKEALISQTEKLNISNIVHFAGTLSDSKLSEAFSSCDFFVLPSVEKSEAFGLVQIEAMAYGKPVINTDLPSGVPYVSLHGVTGLTVPPADENALAAAMQQMIDDPDQRYRFGRAAYQRVRQEFSLDRMLAQILSEYKDIVNK